MPAAARTAPLRMRGRIGGGRSLPLPVSVFGAGAPPGECGWFDRCGDVLACRRFPCAFVGVGIEPRSDDWRELTGRRKLGGRSISLSLSRARVCVSLVVIAGLRIPTARVLFPSLWGANVVDTF